MSLLALVAVRAADRASADAPLAIRGYDPVAYFTAGRPTPGRSDVQYMWDEQVFRFANPENRDLFKADPARYAPQFANFCAMALTRGELVEADPQNWLISEGRLFIFAKPLGVERFQLDVAGNVEKANEYRRLVPGK